MAAGGRSTAYVPALDGLRAVAILAVVSAHAGLPQLGGYLGVTLFFVISGFLITRLLLAELDGTGRMRLTQFYRRRFARLGPALLAVLAVTTAYLLLLGSPVSSWIGGLAGASTYTSDLLLVSPARHRISDSFRWSWSLSIEEQFYLLWPAILLLLQRFRKGTTAAVTAALLVAVVANRSLPHAAGFSHERLFYSLDTHADSILAGCLIALLPVAGRRLVCNASAVLGVVILVRLYADPAPLLTQDRGSFTLATIGSAAVIFALVNWQRGPLTAALSTAPAVLVGRLSYGIYLTNALSIAVFERLAHEAPLHTPLGLLWAAATLGVCWLSYRYLETPLRIRLSAPRSHAGVGWPTEGSKNSRSAMAEARPAAYRS